MHLRYRAESSPCGAKDGDSGRSFATGGSTLREIGVDRHLLLDVGVDGRRATVSNALSESHIFGFTKKEAEETVRKMGLVVGLFVSTA